MAETIVIDGVYTLRRKVGSGGMGDVYLAQVDLEKFDYSTLFAYTQVPAENHTERRKKAETLATHLREKKLDPATMSTLLTAQGIPTPSKVVAVKLTRSAAGQDRFEAEWKNLLCLSHKNIIAVYGGGVYDQRPYYAMEYLKDIVPPSEISRKFTIRQKLELLVQAGRGLQFLHDNGIVHRDVKPANIVTCETEDGAFITKITDLGLAKNLQDNLGLTHADMILGSPAYMAPEQIESSSEVDHRADVYSLGATMYELLTGTMPYNDKDQAYQVIIAVSTNVPPKPPNEIVEGLPQPITQIIQTAMEFDRNDRYQSVDDMVDDIKTYLAQESAGYTSATSFVKADKAKSSAKIGGGSFLFEEMLKTRAPERLVDEDAPPPIPKDIEAYRLLVMNRKHAQHTVFKRCAETMSMEYLLAQTPLEAADLLVSRPVDIAMFEYTRHDTQVRKLCDHARKKSIPFILNGNNLSRTDILAASRLGASAVMLNPVGERAFKQKVRAILQAAAPSSIQAKPDITTINFKGKKTPPERARVVAKTAPKLLVLPHAASKVISICGDPNASADDLAMPIQSDSAVAAMVLRRANSAALAGNRRIVSIRDAVVRIGRKETRQLAITMAVYKLFDKQEKSFGFNRYMYWVHALGAGIGAKMLAERVRGIDEQSAFLAGLLHDLGKIVFDDHLNRDYREVLSKASSSGQRVCKAEQERFMMDHAFMGARIGERWNIPKDITEAIEQHHRPAPPTDPAGPAVSLAQLAAMGNSVVKAMGAGHSGDFLVEDLPPKEWEKVLPKMTAAPEYAKLIRKELAEFAEMLGIDRKESGFDSIVPPKDKTVGVVPDGLGVLLLFFFASRGYKTRILDWQQFANAKDDVACDLRAMPPETRQTLNSDELYFGRQVFLLNDEAGKLPVRTMRIIAPANDFFQLEQVVGKAYAPDPESPADA